MPQPTLSPRRHLVQALTLVNDIVARRRRDGLSLSDEENELLNQVFTNAPRPEGAPVAAAAPAAARRRSSGSPNGSNTSPLSPNTSTAQWGKRGHTVSAVIAAAGADLGDDASLLVNFAVSVTSLTSQPVSIMQLLVEFITKLVPDRKPVSCLFFDGEYTVDAVNGTLLANSSHYLSLFSNDDNDAKGFVFDQSAAACYLPISAEGELFGFVQITNMQSAQELPAERLLVAATAVAALGLRTAWQLEDMEWSHRKQALLLKIAHNLTSESLSSKEADVVKRLVSKAPDLADAQSAYYFKVVDEQDQHSKTHRELRYFHDSEFYTGDDVFTDPLNMSSSVTSMGSAANSPTARLRSPGTHDSSDDELSDHTPTSDNVRLAFRTAEQVFKHNASVVLQQARGDQDTYVDAASMRLRHGGAGGAARSSNPALAAAVSGGVSLGRGTTKNMDLSFSLAKTRSVHSLLGVPVLDDENKCKAVIVLTNKRHRRVARIDVPQAFADRDQEMMLALCGLASIALANSAAANRLKVEKRQRDAILSVVAHLNECDIRNVGEICKYVMHGAKRLLNADRSTLFLIDEEHDELYSAVADSVGKVIRFPVGKGIAGRVALTGKAEVVREAYSDDRFNAAIDRETGYKTLSILTVPVIAKGNTLAVAQLVNKLDKAGKSIPFSNEDVDVLRTFSLFAGIAIGNSRLLEFTVKAGQEAMALTNFDGDTTGAGLLQRRNTLNGMPHEGASLTPITDSERQRVVEAMDVVRRLKETNPAKFDYTKTTFDLFALREEAPDAPTAKDYGAATVMLLLEHSGYLKIFKIDDTTMINAICHARSLQRSVHYHNFYHIVDVVQTLYTYLFVGDAKQQINELEAFVLLLTGLFHDLDHFGLNNSYFLKADTPLGILSSVSGNNSVLEVHHCNLAVQILQSPDANVLSNLNKEDNPKAYRLMLQCILATDMARHGEILKQFEEACGAGASPLSLQEGSPKGDDASKYDKNNDQHRLLAMQILIKSADISNVTKPFELSRQWAAAVTAEFLEQGDKEREKGLQVLPMNDRTLGTELAKGQLGFINFVAEKFFIELQRFAFSKMGYLLTQLRENKDRWQKILDDKAKEVDKVKEL